MPRLTWKFVSTPEANSSVLLDMNSHQSGIIIDMDREFDISPPSLIRTLANNSLTEGAEPVGGRYDNRILKCTVGIQGTEEEREARFSALMVQLSKPRNLIMYRPFPADQPVFFRTMRSDDTIISNRGGASKIWRVTMNIMAEPYAIGERRQVASGVVVQSNPVQGTNPIYFDMSGIIGDSPTPAFARVVGVNSGGVVLLAQRTRNNPAGVTLFLQVESATLDADTVVWTGANYSPTGGTNNATRTTFGTNSLINRLSYTNLFTGGDPLSRRGTYRVLLKGTSSTANTVFKIRYRLGVSPDFVHGPTTTMSNFPSGGPTDLQIMDLGVMQWPPFQSPQKIGYSELEPDFGTATFSIQAQRVSGTGNLELDYIYFMPADERLCAVHTVLNPDGLIIDGPNDMTYGIDAGVNPFGASNRRIDNAGGIVARYGGLPYLVPGVTNRWYTIESKATPFETNTWDVWYWPRWREVAV
jgi:hypothetical protein